MRIDEISKMIVMLALYAEQKKPGSVSEIWLDKVVVDELKANIPTPNQVFSFTERIYKLIDELTDKRRKSYLKEIVHSLEVQIKNNADEVSYSDFCEENFGYRIERVTEEDLESIEQQIVKIEKAMHITRFKIFKKYEVFKNQCKAQLVQNIEKVKRKLPDYLLDFPDKGFTTETTTGKPWSAFNMHTAPYKSVMTLNEDIIFTQPGLYRLASHEGYGGHHAELSNKDTLLVEEGKGEHGLVITYSPQAFVSEGLAEAVYVLLGIMDEKDNVQMLGWQYDRLVYALYNKIAFMHFDDGLSKEKIAQKLGAYGIDAHTQKEAINFATDAQMGRYAPVYYSAMNFIIDLYKRTSRKEELIKTLFSLPCTPKLLAAEF